VAWRLSKEFRISLLWIESGLGSIESLETDFLPDPIENNIRKFELLTTVVDGCKQAVNEALSNVDLTPVKLKHVPPLNARLPKFSSEDEIGKGTIDVESRIIVEEFLTTMAREWVAHAPLGKTTEMAAYICQAAQEFIDGLPAVSSDEVIRRWKALDLERIRNAHLMRTFRRVTGQNKQLTQSSEKHRTGEVMKPIPSLKEVLSAVKKATAERGQRASLARRFKISQASLSEWLRGESEPGGEITLRLWKWVTDPKREH
jgi:hypothetical protein